VTVRKVLHRVSIPLAACRWPLQNLGIEANGESHRVRVELGIEAVGAGRHECDVDALRLSSDRASAPNAGAARGRSRLKQQRDAKDPRISSSGPDGSSVR